MSINVYSCFDAAGSKNPAETDLKYYFLLRAWGASEPLQRAFVDVHRTHSIPQRRSQLRSILLGRLRRSDLVLLILSERTARSTGWLPWEIGRAVTMKLPIVCAYTGASRSQSRRVWLPAALEHAAQRRQIQVTHIDFNPSALAAAFRHLGQHGDE